jgi:uncharacterized protein
MQAQATRQGRREQAVVEFADQATYYVAFFVISGMTIEEVIASAPDALATHLKRSKELRRQGTLLMAGAFLHNAPDEPLTTMGVFLSRADAEAYAAGDPFVLNGMVTNWYIREWANILVEPKAP